jgi:predicted dehydrogenase
MKQKKKKTNDFNRRDFLKGSSAATLMGLLGGVELIMDPQQAKAADAEKLQGPAVKTAVIGLGARGREIVATLARLPEAEVVGLCDTYAAATKRASKDAPSAASVTDYRQILDNKAIKAVFIATPSHQHRSIALAALQAGKHVYCEAPLAHTIEDTRAIAKAAKEAATQVFQPGLQFRSDPQRHFLLTFIRSGSTGKAVFARAQWHKKTSWRTPAPTSEREKEINWRLQRELSPGLMGEIGLHQYDVASWFLNARPKAVTGFGGLLHWTEDGRDVPDTIQAVFEFPGGANFAYDATLANSFDSDYEMFHGTDSAVMLRGNKAWMFKEVDSPLLGWEVYARKDTFYKETGVALVANATKLKAQGDKPVEEAPFTNTPLFYGLQNFLSNVTEYINNTEDFKSMFKTNDKAALVKHLTENVRRQPAAGWKEGLESTIVALKANEAILKKERIVFQKEWFDLG